MVFCTEVVVCLFLTNSKGVLGILNDRQRIAHSILKLDKSFLDIIVTHDDIIFFLKNYLFSGSGFPEGKDNQQTSGEIKIFISLF